MDPTEYPINERHQYFMLVGNIWISSRKMEEIYDKFREANLKGRGK